MSNSFVPFHHSLQNSIQNPCYCFQHFAWSRFVLHYRAPAYGVLVLPCSRLTNQRHLAFCLWSHDFKITPMENYLHRLVTSTQDPPAGMSPYFFCSVHIVLLTSNTCSQYSAEMFGTCYRSHKKTFNELKYVTPALKPYFEINSILILTKLISFIDIYCI